MFQVCEGGYCDSDPLKGILSGYSTSRHAFADTMRADKRVVSENQQVAQLLAERAVVWRKEFSGRLARYSRSCCFFRGNFSRTARVVTCFPRVRFIRCFSAGTSDHSAARDYRVCLNQFAPTYRKRFSVETKASYSFCARLLSRVDAIQVSTKGYWETVAADDINPYRLLFANYI